MSNGNAGTVSLDDIDQLSKEVEMGARGREDSMESGASSRPLHTKTSAESNLGRTVAGLLVILLVAMSVLILVHVGGDSHDDNETPDGVIMSTSPSIRGFDYVGALYAGEGEWVDKLDAPLPASGRSDLQVISCGADNAIFLLGGLSEDSTVLDLNLAFNPAFETYEEMEPMPTPRYRFGAACSGNTIYVLGGFTTKASGDNGENVKTMDAYDINSNTWTTGLSEMPAERSDLAVSVVGNKLYAFGGYGYQYAPTDTVTEIYDISLNEWSTGLPIPSRRGDLVSIAVGTDIYVLGGWIDNYPVFNTSPALEKYDTLTGEWTQLADMQIGRGDCGVARVGDKLYVIGGETSAYDSAIGETAYEIPMHDVEQYDILNNVWVRMAPIPAPRFRFGAAAAGETIYTFGGHAQGTQTVNTVQAFYYVDRPNIFLHQAS